MLLLLLLLLLLLSSSLPSSPSSYEDDVLFQSSDEASPSVPSIPVESECNSSDSSENPEMRPSGDEQKRSKPTWQPKSLR